jgi:hypothetical protein
MIPLPHSGDDRVRVFSSTEGPRVGVGGSARLTAMGNRMTDKGSGAGTFFNIGADDWHRIIGNAPVGWSNVFPTPTIDEKPDTFRVVPTVVNLTKEAEARALIAEVVEEQRKDGFNPDLVIVDTLARCSAGADENSAGERVRSEVADVARGALNTTKADALERV